MLDPLDIEQPGALITYLRETKRIADDEQPLVRTLAGGVSNRTVLVERAMGEAWVLKQALAKLRVTVDWFSDPIRIEREAAALRWLPQLAPAGTITPLVFEDRAHHILAMQAVPQPHDNWKNLLLTGCLAQDHIKQFGTLLGTIHRNAYEQRARIAPLFADSSFFESLRLEPYYSYTASQMPAAADFLLTLINTTRVQHLTLVHGDYSPKNILVYQGKLILLDHEVIHFGDPAFDIGFSLTHLLSKAHHLVEQRQAFTAAAQLYWQCYLHALGELPWRMEMEVRACQHTLACLLARVAGRSQLEYLSPAERAHQRAVVLALLTRVPETISETIDQFVARL